MKALSPTLLVTVAATLWWTVAALGADPAVVEIGMINKPDGSQFMTLSRGSVPAGPVVFRVMNHSADMIHEFLVVQTSLDPNAFPIKPDEPKVDETKLKGITELGDLSPGKSGEMNAVLKPGRYVMFCNQPGHFQAGMFAILAVAP
jgi:uncharacterized cupredoxin-like copper-binding protein